MVGTRPCGRCPLSRRAQPPWRTQPGSAPVVDYVVVWVWGFWPDPVTGWLVPGQKAIPLPYWAPTWDSPGQLSPATCARLDHAGERVETPSQVSFGTCSTSWLDQWSAESMGVYTVSVIEVDGHLSKTPFGVLCSSGTAPTPGCKYTPQFNYDIWFDDVKTGPVVIQMDYHPGIPWGPDIEHMVKAYNSAATWTEGGPAAGLVALHWPDDGLALDVEAMRSGPHPQAPPWLCRVHEQVQRYLMLERVTTLIAPVAPMPSPVQLDAALGPCRDTLQMVGHDVLHLLALVAEATRDPLADARVLTERTAGLTERARLAYFVAKSHILDFMKVPDMRKVDMKELAADMGEALCGSVLLEPGGNYMNVVGFWRWLTADDGISAPRELEHLDIALRHLGGQSTYYLGGTPTYTKFREVPMGDDYSQPISFALEVTYLGGVVLRYERVNARALGAPGRRRRSRASMG